MSFITAFQANAFQASPLAFQISGTPPPTPVVPPEDIGGGYMANPNAVAAYRKRLEEQQRNVPAERRLEDREQLRRFVARAFGMETEQEPQAAQIVQRTASLAEFYGYAARQELIAEIVAEEIARLALLRQQQEDDIVMVLLLSS